MSAERQRTAAVATAVASGLRRQSPAQLASTCSADCSLLLRDLQSWLTSSSNQQDAARQALAHFARDCKGLVIETATAVSDAVAYIAFSCLRRGYAHVGMTLCVCADSGRVVDMVVTCAMETAPLRLNGEGLLLRHGGPLQGETREAPMLRAAPPRLPPPPAKARPTQAMQARGSAGHAMSRSRSPAQTSTAEARGSAGHTMSRPGSSRTARSSTQRPARSWWPASSAPPGWNTAVAAVTSEEEEEDTESRPSRPWLRRQRPSRP